MADSSPGSWSRSERTSCGPWVSAGERMMEILLFMAALALAMIGPYYKRRRATMSAAVNTPTPVNLDTDGNTAGGVQVPANATRISQIIVSLSASIVAVASSGVSVALKLTGDGLADGQQEIDVGGVREDTTSTGGFKAIPPNVIDTNINVVAGNTVNIAYVMGGVDPGSPEIGVTLVFE